MKKLAASGFRNKIRSFSGNSNKSSLLINQYHIITTITANMVQVAAALGVADPPL